VGGGGSSERHHVLFGAWDFPALKVVLLPEREEGADLGSGLRSEQQLHCYDRNFDINFGIRLNNI
jgi:hypothetical protein